MRKIAVVFGTRPEAIKMCPLVIELRKREDADVIVVLSGQHKHMTESVMELFSVVPDYNLDIMSDKQSLFDITGLILDRMKDVLLTIKPDIVLVHGDTSTAFATALTCYYLKIPVGHVEAGLRTYDVTNPYPEEFNRQAIDIISNYHFAPTEIAKSNLLKEGRNPNRIWVTGNTIVDALRYTTGIGSSHPEFEWIDNSRMVLITAHRRESVGKTMEGMFKAIRRVLDEHRDVKAIFPVHLNPAVRVVAERVFSGCENIHLIEPLNVVDFHGFESRCFLCLTDSGGIQEECTALGKPVLLMRSITERPEGVDIGTIKLVGVEEDNIYSAFSDLLSNSETYKKMLVDSDVFGDGHASERIADVLTME